MTPEDIRELADDCGPKQTRYVASQCAITLLALADVVEAVAVPASRMSPDKQLAMLRAALDRLEAIKP